MKWRARPCAKEIRGAFVASTLQARQEVVRYGQVMEAANVHKCGCSPGPGAARLPALGRGNF